MTTNVLLELKRVRLFVIFTVAACGVLTANSVVGQDNYKAMRRREGWQTRDEVSLPPLIERTIPAATRPINSLQPPAEWTYSPAAPDATPPSGASGKHSRAKVISVPNVYGIVTMGVVFSSPRPRFAAVYEEPTETNDEEQLCPPPPCASLIWPRNAKRAGHN
jgi:hypothetical protein